MDEKIRDDISERKNDRGQLSKERNPSLDALEHREMKKERHADEAWKKRVKLT